jgi:hypothetical protein
MIDLPRYRHRVSDLRPPRRGRAQIRRLRTVQVSTTTMRLNSIGDSPLVFAGGVGVMADLASRADRPCGVRAHRRPAWSISPATVAREPATAECRLAQRSRSGSLPECHRGSRCSARRARITGRGTTTAGRLDWVLWSESSMLPIKPSDGRSVTATVEPILRWRGVPKGEDVTLRPHRRRDRVAAAVTDAGTRAAPGTSKPQWCGRAASISSGVNRRNPPEDTRSCRCSPSAVARRGDP